MNKNIIRISTLLATSLWVSQLLAGNVTIPNTFVSGTAASASEVNANFGAIKAEVDDNDNRITTNAGDISANASNIIANTNAISGIGGVGVFVNGARVGSFLGFSGADFPVLLPSNYLTRVYADGTGLSGVFGMYIEPLFLLPNCAGQPYVRADSMNPLVKSGQGQVFHSIDLDPVPYRYVPAGTPVEILTYNSMNIGADCQNVSGTTELYKSYPNDSAVTGITGAEFIGSVTIAH